MIVNPLLWYGTRELKVTPPHFTKCTTPLTDDSLQWVITKLQGRFSKEDGSDDDDFFVTTQYILFEDPAEAMIYELRWSGTK
jgi:hypothetical protein